MLLVEYGRSAACWAQRLVFVNGHGGNVGALTPRGAAGLRAEGRDVGWCPCAAAGGDAHAGHTETSVLLHISPADVLTDRWLAGNGAPLPELLPSMRRGGSRGGQPGRRIGGPDHRDRSRGQAHLRRDGRRLCAPSRPVVARARRDADMSQPRLPDGFAVQVDRRVRVLGDGSALLGGSPTRLLRLAPAAQDMLSDGRLKVRDDVSAQLARTLLDATVAHPRPAGGPSHRDVTVVIPVRDNASGVRRLVSSLRGLRVIVVDDGSSSPDRAGRLRRRALRYRSVAPPPQQGAGGGAQHRVWRPAPPTSSHSWIPTSRRGGAGWRRCSVTSATPPSPWSHRASSGLSHSENVVARYEAVHSSLDLGQREAPVLPHSTVSYVPSAAIICRRVGHS